MLVLSVKAVTVACTTNVLSADSGAIWFLDCVAGRMAVLA